MGYAQLRTECGGPHRTDHGEQDSDDALYPTAG